jgi:hypothetical protein
MLEKKFFVTANTMPKNIFISAHRLLMQNPCHLWPAILAEIAGFLPFWQLPPLGEDSMYPYKRQSTVKP